jgi:hypothetical protein
VPSLKNANEFATENHKNFLLQWNESNRKSGDKL